MANVCACSSNIYFTIFNGKNEIQEAPHARTRQRIQLFDVEENDMQPKGDTGDTKKSDDDDNIGRWTNMLALQFGSEPNRPVAFLKARQWRERISKRERK